MKILLYSVLTILLTAICTLLIVYAEPKTIINVLAVSVLAILVGLMLESGFIALYNFINKEK